MAINRIESVSIDSNNQVFGGYIYGIDYNFGLSAETSSVTVTLFSETGDYFIAPEDLKTSGSPTEIRIGNNITFYGYPITYRFEKSVSGKLLVVEYVDESIAYLDLRRIELKGRVGATPVIRVTSSGREIIEPEVPSRIILLGAPFYTKQLVGRNIRISLTNEVRNGTQVNVYPDYVILESNSLLSLEDYAEIPEVLYTFPELITAIQDIVGTPPILTSDYSNYYRNYTGTIREVLSQWSSDLGITFYWKDRKLHFIDLRNPNTFQVIKERVDNLLATLKPESIEESYTLRGTAAKAVTSQYFKTGQVVNDGESESTRRYRFERLRIDNIPGLKSYFGATSMLSDPWINWIKAGKYGKELIVLSLCKRSVTTGFTYFPSNTSTQNAALAAIRLTNTDTQYNFLKTEADIYFGINSEYIFFKVYKNESLDSSIQENFHKYLEKFEALAKYMARFQYFDIGKYEYDNLSFDKETLWFHRGSRFRETPMGKLLEPLKDVISNYDDLTVEGFIEGSGSTYNASYMSSLGRDNDGYAISEIEPVWSPSTLADVLDSRRIFLYEPTSESSNLTKGTFYVGVVLGDSGTILSQQNEAEALSSIDIESIREPFESGIDVFSHYKRKLWPYIQGKHEFVRTSYCDGYDEANVERIDMDTISIPEELIVDQGSSLEWENNINQNNFDSAHSIYSQPLLFSQTQPFFTKNISLPYISLDTDLSPENGFQSLSITYGSNGVTANYTFGTEKMIVPNPEFYLSTFYDTSSKKVKTYFKQKQILPRGYKVIY